MVRNKELVVFRGIGAVRLGLEELEEKVIGMSCQEALSNSGRMRNSGA